VDVLVRVAQLTLPGVLQDLQSRGFDVDMIATIREWTEHHLTQIHYQGVPIDWLKPLLPCLNHAIDRASVEKWLDANVRIASAEDLILLKVLSLRSQDELDIQNLLAANSGLLDLDTIRRELQDALPEADQRVQRFEELVSQHYDSEPLDSGHS
jgi:hypothetical protein